MKLYNTLTRKKEEFTPLEGNTVRMYSCGPTVYNYAHIGNMRTYVFMDLLRRVLKEQGYKIKGVMNITDVGHLLSDADDGEDKMEKAAKEQKKSPYEIAAYYTKIFFEDLKKLNIDIPEILPKATEHIPEMLDIVYELYDKGYAYETDDGIYFDISKFPDYGRLSGINLEDQLAGARVEVNSGKRHPADFAIWKKAPKEHIMQWDSRWGKGYPDCHIECSAMSKKLGNTYTLDDLEKKGYSPMCFRLFCLNTHYRKKLNFTFEGMDAAKTSYERLKAQILKHKASPAPTDKAVLDKYFAEFEREITDDLNIPGALGVLFTMLKEKPSKDIYDLAVKMDAVFGLGFADMKEEAPAAAENVPEEIKAIAEERFAARQAKDWAKSDELRNKLSELGYSVKDAKDGYTLTKN